MSSFEPSCRKVPERAAAHLFNHGPTIPAPTITYTLLMQLVRQVISEISVFLESHSTRKNLECDGDKGKSRKTLLNHSSTTDLLDFPYWDLSRAYADRLKYLCSQAFPMSRYNPNNSLATIFASPSRKPRRKFSFPFR